MTFSARVIANRKNAKRSTGPKGVAGKKRVSQNALRHGLSVPVALLPEYGSIAARLAALIAGPNPEAKRLCLARQVAEAEVDLARVRQARMKSMEPREKLAVWATTGLRPGSRLSPFEVNQMLEQLIGEATANQQLAQWVSTNTAVGRKRSAKLMEFAPGWGDQPREVDIVDELTRLDRYERCALSRLRSAIRALDNLTDFPPEMAW